MHFMFLCSSHENVAKCLWIFFFHYCSLRVTESLTFSSNNIFSCNFFFYKWVEYRSYFNAFSWLHIISGTSTAWGKCMLTLFASLVLHFSYLHHEGCRIFFLLITPMLCWRGSTVAISGVLLCFVFSVL